MSYRVQIGVFVGGCFRGGSINSTRIPKCDNISNYMTDKYSVSRFISVSIVYLYFMLCVLGLVMGMAIECKFKSSDSYKFQRISNMEMLHLHLTHVKMLSAVLIAFLVTRDCITFRYMGCFAGLLGKALPTRSTIVNKHSSRILRAVAFIYKCILWIFLINSALVTNINPSLLNPGPPQTMRIVSFNCQGLILFSELGEEHPLLDFIKMYEINRFLCNDIPDIFMLNETWLKKSIKNSELVPVETYKTFRLDW